MPRTALLQARVDSSTAALVRVHAERAQMSTSEWIAMVLRRELSRSGAADALGGWVVAEHAYPGLRIRIELPRWTKVNGRAEQAGTASPKGW